jgi:AcrR family transcriptional regulator
MGRAGRTPSFPEDDRSRGLTVPTRKPTPKSKSRYHHGDLRRALIDASLALIAEEGFGALTLREVARRAGVTHAAPYRHFADKEALLAAVAAEGFRAMAERMRVRMDAAEGPAGRLVASGVAYVLFAVQHPAHFRVMFGPHFTHPPDFKRQEQEQGTSAFDLLMTTIEQGQRAGALREGEPRVLSLTAWSLVHGLASLLVDGQLGTAGKGPADAEHLATVQTRLLLQGLLRGAQGG